MLRHFIRLKIYKLCIFETEGKKSSSDRGGKKELLVAQISYRQLQTLGKWKKQKQKQKLKLKTSEVKKKKR